MPQISKKDLTIAEQYNELLKDRNREEKKLNEMMKIGSSARRGGNTELLKQNKLLDDANKKIADFRKEISQSEGGAERLTKSIGKMASDIKLIPRKAKELGNFFGKLADKSKEMGDSFAALGTELTDAMVSGDKAREAFVRKAFNAEKEILGIMQSKTKFMEADLDASIAAAEARIDEAKSMRNVSTVHKNILKYQLQQLKT